MKYTFSQPVFYGGVKYEKGESYELDSDAAKALVESINAPMEEAAKNKMVTSKTRKARKKS